MKFRIILTTLLITSCMPNIKRFSDTLEIENIMNTIYKSNYSYLIRFLEKEPSTVSFNPDPDISCVVIKPDIKKIIIPRNKMEILTIKNALIAKGLYEYMLRKKFHFDDYIPTEARILSSYIEMEFIFNYLSDDTSTFINTPYKEKICAYLTNEEKFEEIISDEEKINDSNCLRPLNNIQEIKSEIKKLKKSISDVDEDNIFRLRYEEEMKKAINNYKGYADASRDYYYFASQGDMDLYREIRKKIFEREEFIKHFKRFYKNNINKFRENRKKISKEKLEMFKFCI